MNKFEIVPKEIDGSVTHEGIQFSACTFIDIYIDGISIEEIEAFESGVAYWPELERSLQGTGNYLLFTCFCGNPDDAGWDYVRVEFTDSAVIWCFERELESRYEFSKVEYIDQIESCRSMLRFTHYPLAIPDSLMPESSANGP